MVRQDQVNLLVYGLMDPILSKNRKIILQNFGQLAFLIYWFLLFEKKKNKFETDLYK